MDSTQAGLSPRNRPIRLLVLVFGTVLAWLALNVRHWPTVARVAAGIASAGALLNAVAIVANGRMPYAPAAAAQVGLAAGETTPKNAPADNHTWFPFLGDVIPVAPLHKVVSIGDLLIGIGIAALIAALMRTAGQTSRSEGGDSDATHQPAQPSGACRLRPGDPRDPALHGRRAVAGELISH